LFLMRQRFAAADQAFAMPSCQKRTTDVTSAPTNRRFWCRLQISRGGNRRRTLRSATGWTARVAPLRRRDASRSRSNACLLSRAASRRGIIRTMPPRPSTRPAMGDVRPRRCCQSESGRDRSITTDVRHLGWEDADDRQPSWRAAALRHAAVTVQLEFLVLQAATWQSSLESLGDRLTTRAGIRRASRTRPLEHANSCRLQSGSTQRGRPRALPPTATDKRLDPGSIRGIGSPPG
jgi:hypothetical protein